MARDTSDTYVVFPKPHAGDIKRVPKWMADEWYPTLPRATVEQWEKHSHPALAEPGSLKSR